MINLYTRHVGHTQYCFGDPLNGKVSESWADTTSEAVFNYQHKAERNRNHSVFYSGYRPIIASFDSLPTLDSHPELFL